jgi:PAS domain-containing protein
VREFEVDFRLQSAVVPYLASSAVVELDGEACALGVGHDIARTKESERALRQAQERMSAQVDELTAIQARLRTEIAEREVAEATLRKVFEASLDSISIRRLRDGVFLDVNKEFEQLTGSSREEVLGKTAQSLNTWTEPDWKPTSALATAATSTARSRPE